MTAWFKIVTTPWGVMMSRFIVAPTLSRGLHLVPLGLIACLPGSRSLCASRSPCRKVTHNGAHRTLRRPSRCPQEPTVAHTKQSTHSLVSLRHASPKRVSNAVARSCLSTLAGQKTCSHAVSLRHTAICNSCNRQRRGAEAGRSVGLASFRRVCPVQRCARVIGPAMCARCLCLRFCLADERV